MGIFEMGSDKKLCYTCLHNADRLTDLRDTDADKLTYMNKLSKIVSVQLVTQDIMGLCTTCVSDLKTSYKFIQKVLSSQSTWKSDQGVSIKIETTIDSDNDSNDKDYKINLAELKAMLEKETSNYASRETKHSPHKAQKQREPVVDYSSDDDKDFNDIGPLSPMPVKSENSDSDDDNLVSKIAKDFPDDVKKEIHHAKVSAEEKKERKEAKKKVEKIHKCNLCTESFAKKWKLQKHLARVHDQEKKFLCNFCDKSFKQSYHLKEHLTSHTGEKNFTCELCDKKFQRASSVKRHMKSHDAPPGQKTKRTPFLCNICGKNFPFSNGVQRHMRVHLGIKRHECQICHRKFMQSTHLHVHMRTHTGEKPYICDTCGEAFSLKARLQKHISQLHEPKPTLTFVCNFCGVDFGDKVQLGSHMNTVHNASLEGLAMIPEGIAEIKLFY